MNMLLRKTPTIAAYQEAKSSKALVGAPLFYERDLNMIIYLQKY